MENRFKKIASLFLLVFIFSACDKFEMRGFVRSYESADQRFKQSMDWNFNHPYKEIAIPVDEYSIFTMADSHVGGTENLDIFLSAAITENAAATVMVGDLTTGNTRDYMTFQDHLPAQDSLPSFQIIGNHDLYFDGWKQFYSQFGSTTYLFTVATPQASDLFIGLDTGSGTLGSDQLEWLKNILEYERPHYRKCILFTHNNLFRIRHTTSTNPFVEEVHELMELCVKHEIDMVITGHDHERNEVTFGNTIHITMDALQDESKNAGYFKLTMLQGKIKYEFVDISQIDE